MQSIKPVKQTLIEAFEQEFFFIKDKFEIMDLLANNSPMDKKAIEYLRLPNDVYNIVWHPGVYLFIGNNALYRVGVSTINSRKRVMDHLDACTTDGKHKIWDIKEFDDKSILLFNVKNVADIHWLKAVEDYFEQKHSPLIKAKRK